MDLLGISKYYRVGPVEVRALNVIEFYVSGG